jgi:DNA polymerase I-like protein with 3'-5' exonuclease and polymerase domains
VQVVLVRDASEIELTSDVVGLDIETSPRRKFIRQGIKDVPADPRLQRTVLAQVAVDDIVYVLKGNFKTLKSLLENKSITKIIHNATFEYKFFKCEFGISIRNLYDTLIAEAVVESGRRPKLSLEAVAMKYLGVKLDKAVRDDFINGARLTPEMLEYAAKDAWVLPKLYRKLEEKMYPKARVTMALEHALVPGIAQMEIDGLLIDQEAWKRQAVFVGKQLRKTKRKLLNALPVPIRRRTIMGGSQADVNLNSRDQLMPLFQAAGLDLPDLKRSTIDERMEHHPHPLLKLYSDYSKLNKAWTTYGYTFLDNVNPVTRRVHQRVKQVETRTGRLAGTAPNLMNIPKRGGTMYRECFIAALHHLLVAADYSQQELRILAQFSRDKRLIEAFEIGEDIHLYVARILFRNKYLTQDSPERDAAKTLNFGLVYGMGVKKLAKALKISEGEARELLNTHARELPGAFEWMNSTIAFAKEHGYVETIIGRRRYLDTTLDDYERQARNTPIQSTAADMTKIAIVKLHGLGLSIVNVVHDEILLEAKEEEAVYTQGVLEKAMMYSAEKLIKDVPFAVESYIAPRWSKPKKVSITV